MFSRFAKLFNNSLNIGLIKVSQGASAVKKHGNPNFSRHYQGYIIYAFIVHLLYYICAFKPQTKHSQCTDKPRMVRLWTYYREEG
jgi:hypothetical protein